MAKKPQLPGANAFFNTNSVPPKEEEAAPDKPTGGETAKTSSKPRRKSAPKPAAKPVAEAPVETAPEPIEASESPAAAMPPLSTAAKLDPAYVRAAAKPAPPRSIPQPETEKVTFYIPSQMLQQLEICRVRLLTEHNIKIGRSQIVQAALALSAHDPKLIAQTLEELAKVWGEENN